MKFSSKIQDQSWPAVVYGKKDQSKIMYQSWELIHNWKAARLNPDWRF